MCFCIIGKLKQTVFSGVRKIAGLLNGFRDMKIVQCGSCIRLLPADDPSQSLDALAFGGGTGENDADSCIGHVKSFVDCFAGDQDTDAACAETFQYIFVGLTSHFGMKAACLFRKDFLQKTVQLLGLTDSFAEDQDLLVNVQLSDQIADTGDPRGCQTDETPALKGEIHISGGGFAKGILFVAGNTLQLFETFLLGERVQGRVCFEQFAVQESHLVSEFFVLVTLVRPEGKADVIDVVG